MDEVSPEFVIEIPAEVEELENRLSGWEDVIFLLEEILEGE